MTHHAYMTAAPAWNTSSTYDSILHTASGETYRRIEPGKDLLTRAMKEVREVVKGECVVKKGLD